MVVAPVAGTLGSTQFPHREALAVHFDAVGLLAGAARLLLADALGSVILLDQVLEGESKGVLVVLVLEEVGR